MCWGVGVANSDKDSGMPVPAHEVTRYSEFTRTPDAYAFFALVIALFSV